MHAISTIFIYFFIPVLSFTTSTPDKDYEIEQLFFSFKSYNPETFMSSAVNVLVHAVHKRSQKVPHTKSGTFRY